MPKGVKTSGSPAEEQDEKLESVGGQTEDNQPESSTGTDDQNTDSSSEREVQQGDAEDAKKTTPLTALRDQLTKAKPAPAADAEEEEEAPAAESDAEEEAKDDDGSKSEDAEADEADGEESEGDEPNDDKDENSGEFLKTLPKESRDAVGRHIASTLKARVEQKLERHPAIKAGRFLETMRTKHGLDEQEVVASLALSAAFKAGDPRAIQALESHADRLRAELQMPSRGADSAIEPFVGALPPEFADMVSVLGMEEKDVRFLAGALKRHKEAPEKKAPPAPTEREDAPPRRSQPPAPQQRTTIAGFHPDDAAAADDAAVEFLVSQGVKQEDLKKVWGELMPILEKRAPVNPQTGKPDVRFIDPERRVKAVRIAHQHLVIAKAKKAAEQKRVAGPGTTGSAPSVRTGSAAPAVGKNPLADLRRKLVRR